MILVLSGIAMLSGFLVVLVFQITRPMINENQRQATEAAVLQVVPGAVNQRDFVLAGDGLAPAAPGQGGGLTHVYGGYGPDGRLLGIAARASAQGYADMIQLLYGYDPACECIRGIKVLKLAETPGLGDKIITDAAFVANFDALDARLGRDGLAHAIVTVKHGSKREDWEIDAISGATISSKAVGAALNASASRLLPRVLPQPRSIRRSAFRDRGRQWRQPPRATRQPPARTQAASRMQRASKPRLSPARARGNLHS